MFQRRRHPQGASLDGVGSRLRNLGIILRIHPRHTDAADDLPFDYDRDAAFHQIDLWYGEIAQPRAATRNNILKRLRWSAKLDRGTSLALGDTN